ncbi:hypothetical protein ACFLVN_05555 [Chloroflexota bacterium]
MTARITILVPRAESKQVALGNVPVVNDLRGKVVGFVDNEGWRCLPIIWRYLARLLADKYKVSDTFMTTVPMVKAAPAEVLDKVARKADVAIVALGN